LLKLKTLNCQWLHKNVQVLVVRNNLNPTFLSRIFLFPYLVSLSLFPHRFLMTRINPNRKKND